VPCEQPACSRVGDCRAVVDKARESALPVWVAMERRCMPSIRRLLEEVDRGRAGTLRMESIREHRHPLSQKVGDWNRFRARTGGTPVGKCCHFRDLTRRALRSDPIRVYASTGAGVSHPDESHDGQTPISGC